MPSLSLYFYYFTHTPWHFIKVKVVILDPSFNCGIISPNRLSIQRLPLQRTLILFWTWYDFLSNKLLIFPHKRKIEMNCILHNLLWLFRFTRNWYFIQFHCHFIYHAHSRFHSHCHFHLIVVSVSFLFQFPIASPFFLDILSISVFLLSATFKSKRAESFDLHNWRKYSGFIRVPQC